MSTTKTAKRPTATEAAWPASRSELWARAKLEPHARNARTHTDAQVALLAASIRKWGFTMPVLVDEAGSIIAGHARVLAAAVLDLSRVPVVIARGWSDEAKRAYLIADNQLALNAGWNEQLLGVELRALADESFDMDLLGFNDSDLARLTAPDDGTGNTDPDDVPDVPAEPVTRPGALWKLGRHSLVCGDCRHATVLAQLLNGAPVDAVWTDPPYGVSYETDAGSIPNDDLRARALAEFLRGAFSRIIDVMKPGAPIYVSHADSQGLIFRRAFEDSGFKLSGCLIWRKSAFTLSRSDYQWQHEPILYGWRPGSAHRWYGGRKQATMRELQSDAFVLQADGSLIVRIGMDAIVISGTDLTATPIEPSVIHCAKPPRNEMHPTVKPVELVQRMLRNSARQDDVVLDPFGGSGSTLMACEILQLHARLVELDCGYCDVIVRRWEAYTGQRALLATEGDVS